MVRHRITTYKVLISHRYLRSEEYLRLVRMLDRAADRDPTWRWQNLSVPADEPIMTEREARSGEIYEARMRERIALVHAVLFPLRDEWLDFGSVYLELVEGTAAFRYRESVPVIGVLPRGADQSALQFGSPGGVVVRWHAGSIIRAVREHAVPASADELVLTRAERQERARIVEALAAHDGSPGRTAAALGIGQTTLRRKRVRYLIRDALPTQVEAAPAR